MANNNQYTIYIRSTKESIPVSKEEFDAYYHDIDLYRRNQQRHGRCVCPRSKWLTCDMDCYTCPFHRMGDELSLDATTKVGKAVSVTLHQLSAGCTGPEVKTIQRIIYARGIDKNITVDGDFGPATKTAVIALQKKLFPSEPNEWDGIVGRKTWEAVLTALK